MSIAIQNSFTDTDKRIVLGNSQWAGLLDAGTDWNIITIAGRVAFDTNTASILGTPRMYIGVLANPTSGLAEGPLNNSCTHFLGFVSNRSPWTLSNISGVNQWTGNSTLYGRKIGSTLATGGSNIGWRVSAAAATNRWGFIVRITKGSPNFTVEAGYNAGTVDDVSLASVNTSLEIQTFSSACSALSLNAGSQQAFAIDEATNGYFNSVCLAWDRSVDALMYVSEVKIAYS